MSKILLVDDDKVFRELLEEALNDQGFDVVTAANGQEALDALNQFTPSVILLDIMMPKLDGFGFLSQRIDQIPVIVISAIDNEEERIKGYQLGADDFLTKPFSVKELTVRIQAIERRVVHSKALVSTVTNSIDKSDDIHFLDSENTVAIASRKLLLTTTEFKLFKYLFERKGDVITKSELQQCVLKKELGQFDRNLDMHISNTRRKLAQTQLPKTMINTVRGQGYSFAN